MMPFLRDVGSGIRSNPARMGLVFFALCTGTIAFTLLLAVLEGLSNRSRDMLESFGAEVIMLRAESGGPTNQPLTEEQAQALRSQLPHARVASYRQTIVPNRVGSSPFNVILCDAELASIRSWPLFSGRFIDARDVRDSARVAVIAYSMHQRTGINPGDLIHLRDTPFEVVGIVRSTDDSLTRGGSTDVFVPLSTPPLWNHVEPPSRKLEAIYLAAPSSREVTALAQAARRVLAAPEHRRITTEWTTAESLLANLERLRVLIRATAGGVSLLCLLLGGSTLMSLMIASVRERVTEIGLRRALGARRRDIAALFIGEGILITLAASIAGVAFAMLGIHLLAGMIEGMPLQLATSTVFIPVVVALVIGGLCAGWPAISAALMPPAEALRSK